MECVVQGTAAAQSGISSCSFPTTPFAPTLYADTRCMSALQFVPAADSELGDPNMPAQKCTPVQDTSTSSLVAATFDSDNDNAKALMFCPCG